MAGGELSGKEFLQGKPCPKCGYVRTSADTSPDWQCPRCQIAYLKYGLPQAGLHARVVAHGRNLAAGEAWGSSTHGLISVNIFAAVLAAVFRLDVNDMLLVYWAQSAIIGISYFVRILSMKQYAALDLDDSYKVEAEGTLSTKLIAATGFLLLYGGAHVVVLALLSGGNHIAIRDHLGAGVVLAVIAFAVNQAYPLADNIRRDRGGIANLSLMMFLPFFRVAPTQVVFLLSLAFPGSITVMLLFIAVRTAVDVLMHVMEQYEWSRVGPPTVPQVLRRKRPPDLR